MKLVFEGRVELGDGQRVYSDVSWGAILIDDVDVFHEVSIKETHFHGKVTVTIQHKDEIQKFTGELNIDLGWGYSEDEPVSTDILMIGKYDIREILSGFEGEKIRLCIFDEPINQFDE